MNHKGRVLALFLFITVILTGCGPILSTTGISDAKDAIAKADEVLASERAPYEYYMAQEYMRKADELWGYSQFGYSSEYAQKAIEMAKAAREKAINDPWKNPLAGK